MIPIKFFPLFLFEVPLGKKNKKTRLLMRYLQTLTINVDILNPWITTGSKISRGAAVRDASFMVPHSVSLPGHGTHHGTLALCQPSLPPEKRVET